MKTLIGLIVFILVTTGCHQQHVDSMDQGRYAEKKQSKLKLITVFNKNISTEKAKGEIAKDGMEVLNVYQGISKSSGQPTLLIGSMLGKAQTNNLLSGNKDISSFTYEETIAIEPDPNKPQ